MEITGEQRIAADSDTVWRHLIDPDTLKACIPGCDRFTGTLEDGYEAVIKQKVGPFPITVTVSLEVEVVSLPDRYRISAAGQGGFAGHGSGVADVTLIDAKGETVLRYTVDAKLGGRLSKLGQPIVTAFAAKLADRFFDRFGAVVAATA
ncbi:CoxG family protein [Thalassorhabdomicrobium marinisediminis]|uniref:CoxG family protein n=1 Tax=Thalassorhabdomicrobium marinisediminis TaxID=2170577 RepID=UPI0024928790|nr:carbon monoxide dehydrogenase subunit G [Thalassorhabdomicrobium marinisediminis]